MDTESSIQGTLEHQPIYWLTALTLDNYLCVEKNIIRILETQRDIGTFYWIISTESATRYKWWIHTGPTYDEYIQANLHTGPRHNVTSDWLLLTVASHSLTAINNAISAHNLREAKWMYLSHKFQASVCCAVLPGPGYGMMNVWARRVPGSGPGHQNFHFQHIRIIICINYRSSPRGPARPGLIRRTRPFIKHWQANS